jgi:hypothetical protein
LCCEIAEIFRRWKGATLLFLVRRLEQLKHPLRGPTLHDDAARYEFSTSGSREAKKKGHCVSIGI